MLSNKMDFSSCVIWIDFYKSGDIIGYFSKFTIMIKVMIKCLQHLMGIKDSHTCNFESKE